MSADSKEDNQEMVNATTEEKPSISSEATINTKMDDSKSEKDGSTNFLQVIDTKLVSNALLSLESKVEEISKDVSMSG